MQYVVPRDRRFPDPRISPQTITNRQAFLLSILNSVAEYISLIFTE